MSGRSRTTLSSWLPGDYGARLSPVEYADRRADIGYAV